MLNNKNKSFICFSKAVKQTNKAFGKNLVGQISVEEERNFKCMSTRDSIETLHSIW